MTNNIPQSSASIVAADERFEHDEQLAQLLVDALAAPRPPRSLQRTIEHGLLCRLDDMPSPLALPGEVRVALPGEDQAGTATQRRLSKLSRRLRISRVVPIAAGLAAMLLVAVVWLNAQPSYGWSTVLNALAKQPVFRVGEAELPMANPLAAVKSEAEKPQRFLSMLLSQQTGQPANSLARLRVVDQVWKQQGNLIWLDVHFEADDGERVDLTLALDPATSLPQTVQIVGPRSSPASPLTVSYAMPKNQDSTKIVAGELAQSTSDGTITAMTRTAH